MEQPEQKPYATKRTARFRDEGLDERHESTIANIEKFGHEVIMVDGDAVCPGWAYTVGVYDTSGKPEIIAIGLRDETAHALLNEAVERVRQGIDLTQGRHQDLIANVECEFRPVDPKWIRQVMGRAYWYNESEDFPVIQAVYPDKENRFPEDPAFDTYFEQPLLQPEVPKTHATSNFWAANDPKSSLFSWKFSDDPHTRVFLSKAVHEKREPITYVSHDLDDGAWQFLGDSMSGDLPPVISCLHHPIDDDPTLKELADLPLGWVAERATPNDPWVRHLHEPEEEGQE